MGWSIILWKSTSWHQSFCIWIEIIGRSIDSFADLLLVCIFASCLNLLIINKMIVLCWSVTLFSSLFAEAHQRKLLLKSRLRQRFKRFDTCPHPVKTKRRKRKKLEAEVTASGLVQVRKRGRINRAEGMISFFGVRDWHGDRICTRPRLIPVTSVPIYKPSLLGGFPNPPNEAICDWLWQKRQKSPMIKQQKLAEIPFKCKVFNCRSFK